MEAFVSLRGTLRIPLVVQVRNKFNSKHPKPARIERRIFELITKPIYSHQFEDPASKCSILKYRKYEALDLGKSVVKENLYENFLVREARKILERNQMIIAVQTDCMDMRKTTFIRNTLLSARLEPILYPHEVIRKALDGTVWKNMSLLIYNHTMLIVSPEPRVSELLKVAKKLPELAVLGGIVGDRLLTKQGLINYSMLPDIDGMRGQLVSILAASPCRTRSLLQNHQQNLSRNLDQYVKQGGKTDVGVDVEAKSESASLKNSV